MLKRVFLVCYKIIFVLQIIQSWMIQENQTYVTKNYDCKQSGEYIKLRTLISTLNWFP